MLADGGGGGEWSIANAPHPIPTVEIVAAGGIPEQLPFAESLAGPEIPPERQEVKVYPKEMVHSRTAAGF